MSGAQRIFTIQSQDFEVEVYVSSNIQNLDLLGSMSGSLVPRTFLRCYSTTISASTKQIADAIRKTANYTPPVVLRQLLDFNQVQRLSLSLGRPNLYRDRSIHPSSLPPDDQTPLPFEGTSLPPGYHLIYFTPAALPEDLGVDGTDRSYSPASPFTRRMWAGGELRWEKSNPLRIGEEAIESTRLISAEPKITRAGEEMIVIGVEKRFENEAGLSLIDRRDWVFRPKLEGPPPQDHDVLSAAKDSEDLLPPHASRETPSHRSRDFLQTEVSLFRFSALTFNGHKIHYSRPWCRDVEGHREIVVHGPLNLINILDFWRDSQDSDYSIPASLSYRATAPFYAGEKYRGILEKDEGRAKVRLWGRDGKGGVRVGMMGDVVG